jgi:hypothetical protein
MYTAAQPLYRLLLIGDRLYFDVLVEAEAAVSRPLLDWVGRCR